MFYAKALKNKSEQIVLDGLKSLIDDNKLDTLVIQSDNGPEFVNNKMKKYLMEHLIFQTVTQPYNPQSNGGIERFN
jgi:transposase InsO family protein